MRLLCIVPYCRHYTGRQPEGVTEWVCDAHWRLLPRVRRLVYNRAQRRWARAAERGQLVTDGGMSFSRREDWLEHRRAGLSGRRLWNRMRRAALDAAVDGGLA